MNRRADSNAEAEARGRQRPDAAELRELRRRLSLAPHNNELRLHLARWLAERGQRQEALAELRELVHLDPNHLVARKLREQLLRQDAEPGSSHTNGPSPPRASEALH
jgi:thioredoxin-like negative regulator of GroEL